MMNKKGFTYPVALTMVVITSISIMGVRTSWRTTMKREREKELIFRGSQIRNAIASYYHSSPGSRPYYPSRLEDLLRDARFSVVKRHLRRVYKDPMTDDGRWRLSLNSSGRVKGVFSKSVEKPIKQGSFPAELSDFENKEMYRDWKFIYVPKTKKSSEG